MISMTELERELAEFGLKRDRVTIWRWRKKGLIPTVRVQGHAYVTRENLNALFEKAKSGLFPV